MRNNSFIAAWLLCLIASAVAAALPPAARADDSFDHEAWRHEESRMRRGYEIVPPGVTLELRGRNRQAVGLGSYLVNGGGCNDCHTHPS